MRVEDPAQAHAPTRTFVRILAALAVILAGLVGAVAPSSPAQAGHCYPVFDADGNVVGQWCEPLLVVKIELDPRPPCACPDWLAIAYDLVTNPGGPVEFATGLHDGLTLLAAAYDSPADAGRLRDQALAAFTHAAAQLQGQSLAVDSVGAVNDGVYAPQPLPWLASAGRHLAAGESYLQRALADPRGAPTYNRLAMAQFDAAYADIAANTR